MHVQVFGRLQTSHKPAANLSDTFCHSCASHDPETRPIFLQHRGWRCHCGMLIDADVIALNSQNICYTQVIKPLCHPLPLVTQRGPSHSNLVFGILNKSEMLYQAKLSRLQRHWLLYPMTANFAQHQSDFWQLNYRSSLPQWPQVT